jgi:hypothetical protein
MIRETITENKINKIINLFSTSKTKYKCKLSGNKCYVISLSKRKTKQGRQYALFCKIYFGKHKGH